MMIDYELNQKEDGEMEWLEQNVVEKLINIASTAEPTIHECLIMWLKISLGIYGHAYNFYNH
jgi:hypothetical protein